MTKPTITDSLKAIGAAIGAEVDKHGGAQGLAAEVFTATKEASVKAADAVSKAANDAGKYFEEKSADFKKKYDEAVKETDKPAEDEASVDKEVTEEMERQMKLDEEEQKLRARLAEIQDEREGK